MSTHKKYQELLCLSSPTNPMRLLGEGDLSKRHRVLSIYSQRCQKETNEILNSTHT